MNLCLCMMVRDEEKWVAGAIDSALELGISEWLIADTGSVDETRSTIHRSLIDVPGELVELEWEGHAKTRSELLRLAHGRGDYLLWLDADMTLLGSIVQLDADVGYGKLRDGRLEYDLPILLRSSRRWFYRGAAHALLCAEDEAGAWEGVDSGLTVVDRRPGSFRPGKVEEDIAALEEALEIDPNDSRSSFYLAQSYAELGRDADAIREYGRRILMRSGEERFVAMLRRARLVSKRDRRSAMTEMLAAWEDRPTRAESLYEAARLARIEGATHLALMFARQASQIPKPADRLFVEPDIYEWGIPVELGAAELAIGDVRRGRQILSTVLEQGLASEDYRDWIGDLLAAKEEAA